MADVKCIEVEDGTMRYYVWCGSKHLYGDDWDLDYFTKGEDGKWLLKLRPSARLRQPQPADPK